MLFWQSIKLLLGLLTFFGKIVVHGNENSCWTPGLCLGHQILVVPETSKKDCIDLCKNTTDCKWASIMKSEISSCHLKKTCSRRVLNEQYETSSVLCQEKESRFFSKSGIIYNNLQIIFTTFSYTSL